MGLPELEARFYPAEAGAEEIPELLRHAAQHSGSEFHFSSAGKRNDDPELAAGTPGHFRLGMKAHQVITHIKRLKGTEEFVPRFLATIEPLAAAGKLGPVLFQLPPNLKADSALLKDFLAILPRAVPAAFEFRHESWFSDATWELLKSSKCGIMRRRDRDEDHARYRDRPPLPIIDFASRLTRETSGGRWWIAFGSTSRRGAMCLPTSSTRKRRRARLRGGTATGIERPGGQLMRREDGRVVSVVAFAAAAVRLRTISSAHRSCIRRAGRQSAPGHRSRCREAGQRRGCSAQSVLGIGVWSENIFLAQRRLGAASVVAKTEAGDS